MISVVIKIVIFYYILSRLITWRIPVKVILFFVFTTALVLTTAAFSHDALPTAAQPLGWTYPWACCSGIDCRTISADRVRQSPVGYIISPTMEVIPYTSTKIKPSPDGAYHWCTKGGQETTATICLFVPPGSS